MSLNFQSIKTFICTGAPSESDSVRPVLLAVLVFNFSAQKNHFPTDLNQNFAITQKKFLCTKCDFPSRKFSVSRGTDSDYAEYMVIVVNKWNSLTEVRRIVQSPSVSSIKSDNRREFVKQGWRFFCYPQLSYSYQFHGPRQVRPHLVSYLVSLQRHLQ